MATKNVKLSKVEKFYIDAKLGQITDSQIAKDLGRLLSDGYLSKYITSRRESLEAKPGPSDSFTFKMFGNTKKGSVISNKGVSEVGDDSRKKNEKTLPPYVRRI